jgi:hypothetical protein
MCSDTGLVHFGMCGVVEYGTVEVEISRLRRCSSL